MSGLQRELMRSLDLQPTIGKLDAGVALDFAEHSLLREAAEARLYHVLGKLESGQVSAASRHAAQELQRLQASCMQVSSGVQTSCLALARAELSPADLQRACEALDSQLTYIKACLQRALGRLHGGT
ncbi:hypothetical protein ACE1YR_01210 [Pseudomonas sp. K1(2024)]|uniref:Uncharacterized protein n=2 Tax=Pseudomonas TaxID=286 RepID=A0AAI8KC85_9PSED|nr:MULTISPECIES: hypothetical protein [Pseudomonas]AIZ33289.1 hypothetical protein NJ69_10000 [Pseudomonas parafulva]AXO88911.1 hypothetical protein DZC75_13220 [Pseudomonas parafulva]MDO7900533.1 hypothetical protein [Pseudomonas sp. K13]MDV9034270.1 hypothetical protein [Pseudomonas sp. RAC1]